MSSRKPNPRAALKLAASTPQNFTWDYEDDAPPLKVAIACQGGGSWAIGVGEAIIPAISEVFAQGGQIVDIAGTSGGGIVAAAAVKGLNEGRGAEGVRHYMDAVWKPVKANGNLFGVSRYKNPFLLSPSDAWPNIPRAYTSLSGFFNYGQPGLATQAIRDMVNDGIGDWASVRNGPTSLHLNTARENIFTGKREHYIFRPEELNGDAVAASAGLRELGGHFILREMQSPQKWVNRELYRYYDGAEYMNPSLAPLLTHSPTDVIVISLHGAPGTPKSPRERKLYTDEIHYDLTHLLLDDSRRYHLHELALRLPSNWNASSRLNTDPAFLEEIQSICRIQAEAWRKVVAPSLGRESTYRPDASVVERLIQQRELVAY